jgi:hypothetical protein
MASGVGLRDGFDGAGLRRRARLSGQGRQCRADLRHASIAPGVRPKT